MNITKEALEFTKADYSQKLYNTEKVSLDEATKRKLQKEYSDKLTETEKELEKYDS